MISVQSVTDQFSEIKAEYSAAKTSRYKRNRPGVNGVGYGGDHHYRSEVDFFRMLEIARDMDRNDGMIGHGIDVLRRNVIKTGMKCEPETGNEEVNSELKQRWKEWGENPSAVTLDGQHDWRSLERLAFRSMILDGDIFALPHVSGAFETIESHRVRTPRSTTKNIIHGVHKDVDGRPIEYYITTKEEPFSVLRPKNPEARRSRDELDFPEVIHLYDPKRFSQSRGVTAMHRVIDTAGQFDDLQFAKLVQAQIVSYFAVLTEREMEFDGGAGAARGDRREEQGVSGESGTTVAKRTFEKLAPGMLIEGQPGEKLQGFSPNAPNETYFPFAKLILTAISVNLGLPLCVFLMDASETNFSGWRGAMDQAREGFVELQDVITSRFHRWVYRWKVRQWMAQDPSLGRRSLEGDVDIYSHRWQPPAFRYIEPVKDATAHVITERNLLNSPRRIHAEQGRNFTEVVRETVEDIQFKYRTARDAARLLNGEANDETEKVTWREMLPMTDGLEIKVNADSSSPQEPKNTGSENAE